MSSPAAKVRPFDLKTDLNRLIAFHLDLIEINFPANGLVDGLEYDKALREEAFGSDGVFRKALTVADPHVNGVYVWEEGKRLVGYIWVALRHDPILNTTIGVIREIYVVPERRGSGLAKHMMAYAQDWFRVHNAKVQRLDVTSTNERAVHLYEKFGYEVYRFEMERVESNDGSSKKQQNNGS
jgi:ribosomal protein S18 acetylase RimI-like enzyme